MNQEGNRDSSNINNNMTAAFPPARAQQTIALAFAVASLQNPGGMEQFLPQALLEAAAASSTAQNKPHFDVNSAQPPQQTDQKKPCVDNAAENTEAEGGDEDDNERRLARSRERNREHARRTRLRKKAQLEALQSKVKGLEAERQVLKQKVEECGIASILLNLSCGEPEQAQSSSATASSNNDSEGDEPRQRSETTDSMVAVLSGAKRKRFISEAIGEQPNQQRLTIDVDGQVTVIGAGKSHINWKTGVYRDQQGVQRQLTPEQLEDLRRERNRMHAKMTRSRKKCFVATIEKAIEELEAENDHLRRILSKVSTSTAPAPTKTTSTQPVAASAALVITPATSPALAPTSSPFVNTEDPALFSPRVDDYEDQDKKRFRASSSEPVVAVQPRASHGFRLDG